MIFYVLNCDVALFSTKYNLQHIFYSTFMNFHRNPSHQLHPSFSVISQKYLKQPSGRLLHWAPENNSLSPAVGICGAPLEEAEKLYLNLQKKYERAKFLN